MPALVGQPHQPRAKTREIVIATLMRSAGGSGVQSHVRTLSGHMSASSRHATVINPFTSRSLIRTPTFASRLVIRRLSRSASVWWYRHWHGYFVRRALAKHLRRHPHSVVYAQCPVSADAALRVRKDQPVVMAVHFNYSSQADEWAAKLEIPEGGRVYRSIREFEEAVLPRLDGIVYVSDFTRTSLQTRIEALRHLPSAVIPNPVPETTAPPDDAGTDLITVGALEPAKNQAYLLEILSAAAREGHRYTLTVVGCGPESSRLKARARELMVADQVRFLGYRPDARELMRQHRVYCHTSKMESFGIVLAEAMAEGLPVVTTSVGATPEVVRTGLDGVHWPLDDARAAATILIDLMEDPEQRAMLSANGLARSSTEFSTRAVGDRLMTFLDSTPCRGASRSRLDLS